jgi:signal transduction histidine kinase
MLPVAAAGILAGAAAAASPLAQALAASDASLHLVFAGQSAMLVGVPAAFLTAVIRRRLADGAIVGLVHRMQRQPTPETVQATMREALDDPTLRVLYWAPDVAAYVDDHGQPTSPAPGVGARLLVPVTTASGEPLAMVETDRTLARYLGLVTAAVSVSGLALENALLQATLRAQLEQVRAARLSIVEAGVTERRRLERDLHDGAQQRLLAVKTTLGAAEAAGLHPEATGLLARIRDEVGHALEELRDLARGIYPVILGQSGLAAAVAAAAERQPCRVDIWLPPRRFPPATEATAYFVICEALTNIARYAEATHIAVRGHEAEGTLTVEVLDDGCGGADPTAGSGLTGLQDRVRALGGHMHLTSPVGGGTRLIVEIPCG